MARIEELIALISDPSLRAEFAREVSELKKRRTFGLVFERHIPETVLVAHAPMKIGSIVVRRNDTTNAQLKVVGIEGTRVTVEAASDENGHELSSYPQLPAKRSPATRETIETAELLLLRRFGDPAYPALSETSLARNATHDRWQVVIEGENYHGLELLGFAMEGRFDVIYLDPPYNIGKDDWSYNNKFVDSNDVWRHSKWLAFMERRLRLSRRLLKSDGVMVVTIDEREVHHLGMLLEQLFPEASTQLVTIVINPKGSNRDQISRVEEYAIFCFFGSASKPAALDDMLLPEGRSGIGTPASIWASMLRRGTDAARSDQPKMFYPVLIDPRQERIVKAGTPLLTGDPNPQHLVDGYRAAWPIRKDGSWGRWQNSPSKLNELVAAGYAKLGSYDPKRRTWPVLYLNEKPRKQIADGELVVDGRDDQGAVIAHYPKQVRAAVKTVWHRARHNAGSHGTDLLSLLVGKRDSFSFPKSLYAVRDTLDMLTYDKPDAMILDAFAGSGTTLHATMLLNAQDQGRRQCVLITNNEVTGAAAQALAKKGLFRGDPAFEDRGVFQSALRPRILAALTGARDGASIEGDYLDGRSFGDGFEENVGFFRIEYLDPVRIELGLELGRVEPLMWISAGARGGMGLSVDATSEYVIATSAGYAVLFSAAGLAGLLAALAARPDVSQVFVVTTSEEGFAEICERLPEHITARMLYRDYLESFGTSRAAS